MSAFEVTLLPQICDENNLPLSQISGKSPFFFWVSIILVDNWANSLQLTFICFELPPAHGVWGILCFDFVCLSIDGGDLGTDIIYQVSLLGVAPWYRFLPPGVTSRGYPLSMDFFHQVSLLAPILFLIFLKTFWGDFSYFRRGIYSYT